MFELVDDSIWLNWNEKNGKITINKSEDIDLAVKFLNEERNKAIDLILDFIKNLNLISSVEFKITDDCEELFPWVFEITINHDFNEETMVNEYIRINDEIGNKIYDFGATKGNDSILNYMVHYSTFRCIPPWK